MFRRVLALATALCTIAAPAHAQFVVIDPANLVQTTLIAYRVQQHYTELRAHASSARRDPFRPSARRDSQWLFIGC